MADEREIEERFWGWLKNSPFIMIGIDCARGRTYGPLAFRVSATFSVFASIMSAMRTWLQHYRGACS